MTVLLKKIYIEITRGELKYIVIRLQKDAHEKWNKFLNSKKLILLFNLNFPVASSLILRLN